MSVKLRLVAWTMGCALFLIGCSPSTSTVKPAETPRWDGTVIVRAMPTGPVVDLTKQTLPPLPGAKVEVQELHSKATTDKAGAVRFTLPLGQTKGFGKDEGVYTFIVSSPTDKFQTSVKKRLTGAEPQFEIQYNPDRDVTLDYSTPPTPTPSDKPTSKPIATSSAPLPPDTTRLNTGDAAKRPTFHGIGIATKPEGTKCR